MVAVVTCHHNPFTPTRDFTKTIAKVGTQIKDYAPETRLPFICLLNGKAILRKQWIYQVKDRDVISFVVLPQGGGSSPLRIVAMIGVMVLAAYTGGLAATAMGFAQGTAGFAAASGIVSGVVGMVGTALVNALIPAQVDTASYKQSGIEASPTYSLSAQGNSARIGDAIPVQYGRMKCYPDFAAAPYCEYSGNEQYLYELFCIGLGEYDISNIYIEDTDINKFAEVETQVVNPGAQLTLFPANVETSTEVASQELLKDKPIGPFIANKAGTTSNKLSVDIVASRGMYAMNKKGNLVNKSATFIVEAQKVDDYGQPVGAWRTLGTHTISAATATPQRRSYTYTIKNEYDQPDYARWQVRVTRTDTKDTSVSVGHEIDWAGLKAYLVDQGRKFDGMTLLAVKIRATNNISQSASKKISVLCTRKLRTWSQSGWSAPVASQSIAWAFADACKADYGGRLDDQQIDLQALVELDRVWSERGDKLNLRIDSKSTVWETLQAIAKAGRAKPYRQGGMVRIFRDAPQSVPSGMFTMSNIAKDSFSVDYILPTDDTADAIEVEYFDERIWQWKTVTAKMPDSRAEEPVSVKLLGVTDRQQAWREGMYMAACNRLRRKSISISTEMEGFIPTMGDLVWISHDMPQWGQSCVVREWNPTLRVLTVSEPLTWKGNYIQHNISLRKPNGEAFGPIRVTKGGTDRELIIPSDVEFDFNIQTGNEMEPTYVSFGWDETWTQPARVLSVRPSGMYKVAIECINEADGVHVAELGEYPVEKSHSQLPKETIRPTVTWLIVRSSPGDVNQAVLSWNPSPWANRYMIEQSNDMITWTRCGESSASSFVTQAMYGNGTYFRVSAYGTAQGPWNTIAYATGADYMWNADETVLMWNADDTTLMWS